MITKKELLNKGFDNNPLLEQKENKSVDFVEMVSLILHSRTQVEIISLLLISLKISEDLKNLQLLTW